MNSNIAKKLFVLLLCFSFFADLCAQGKNITVDVKNGNLRSLLELIEKQSGYVFSYRDDAVDNKMVTVKVKDASVSQALDKALAGTDLSYNIVSDNSIVISEKKAKKESKGSKITVSGTVIDSTGSPS